MGVEDHGEYRINLRSSNYDRISIDINNIINILKESIKELDAEGTFTIIEHCTNAMKQMQNDDKTLLEDVENNEKFIEELQKKCEEERLYNLKTIEETHTKIQKLRFNVEEEECECMFSLFHDLLIY